MSQDGFAGYINWVKMILVKLLVEKNSNVLELFSEKVLSILKNACPQTAVL